MKKTLLLIFGVQVIPKNQKETAKDKTPTKISYTDQSIQSYSQK